MWCCCYWNLHRFDHRHLLRVVLLLVLERIHPLVVRTCVPLPPLPIIGWIKLRYFMVHHGHKNHKNYALHFPDPCFGFSIPPCHVELDLLRILYKKDKFYAGMGDIPSNVYTSQNKKNFLFVMLFESVILLCFFGYFLCVTAAYSEDMHGPEEVAAPVEEDKPASRAPSAQSKKSKQPSAQAEEAPAEGEAPAEDAAAE